MHKLSVALNGKELGFLKELSLFGGITYRTSFTVFFTCIFILQNTSFVPFFLLHRAVCHACMAISLSSWPVCLISLSSRTNF